MTETDHKPLLLMVEDNEEVRQLNKKMLENRGYLVMEADTLSEARIALRSNPISLILLDIMLPDGSGLDFCEEIRESFDTPILILSGLREQETVVKGLLIGGDDYLTKPYTIDELYARIVAILRRSSAAERHETEQLGVLRVDFSARRAFIGERDILLKPKEFALLETLIRKKGQYLSTEQLYEAVWGLEATGDFRTIWVHINRLRNKITGSGCVIENDKGLGYRLVEERD